MPLKHCREHLPALVSWADDCQGVCPVCEQIADIRRSIDKEKAEASASRLAYEINEARSLVAMKWAGCPEHRDALAQISTIFDRILSRAIKLEPGERVVTRCTACVGSGYQDCPCDKCKEEIKKRDAGDKNAFPCDIECLCCHGTGDMEIGNGGPA